jgi:hypothetical protein
VRPVLAALILLAGCEAGVENRGIRTLSVLDGAVSVRGPDGYCVDQQSSRAGSGFAVLAGCAVVSDATMMPTLEGLITVQIGAAGSASVTGAEPEMAALLRTSLGAQLLSATSNPASVQVARVDRADGVVVVRFSDATPAATPGLEPSEWRAFLDIRGRLTTISLRGFVRAPIPSEQGLRLLSQAIGALRAANAPVPPT